MRSRKARVIFRREKIEYHKELVCDSNGCDALRSETTDHKVVNETDKTCDCRLDDHGDDEPENCPVKHFVANKLLQNYSSIKKRANCQYTST